MIEKIHLQILREVVKEGTLTIAAKNLYLTQSALSHSIKKLEQQLGVKVWRKQGRKLFLTDAGRYLLGLANRVLPQFEHAEQLMYEFAQGNRGTLRIGMECHPCYLWLQGVVLPFLNAWPGVDVDVKREFQFGGIAALFNFDIDALVTPDPLFKTGLIFEPVFEYELVLVVSSMNSLAGRTWLRAEEISNETLITYPVPVERLDIYNQFLIPAAASPKRHKSIEATEMILQLVAANRGVAALPDWLVRQYQDRLDINKCQLGEKGIHKNIYLGVREADVKVDYIRHFVEQAKLQN